MLLFGYNPLKGKNYEETYSKNRECKIELDKQSITEKFGEECFEFLSKVLEREPKNRFLASEGLHSPFFKEENIKKMEERAEKYLAK